MSLADIDAHIEALVAERAERWRMRKPVNGITEALEEAWADRRRVEAEARNGQAQVVIARARVERELEKLMNADIVE